MIQTPMQSQVMKLLVLNGVRSVLLVVIEIVFIQMLAHAFYMRMGTLLVLFAMELT